MKKLIYLLVSSLAFINTSCASLSNFFNGSSGACNCDCEVCRLCKNKQHAHNLSPQDQARLQALATGQSQSQEDIKRRAEIDSLLNIDYSIVIYDIPDIKEPEPYTWDDDEKISTPIDSLMPLFRTSTNSNGETQYIMKGINTSFKENDVYFYFKTKNGVPEPLRLVVHYFADDPVEFYDLKFEIDYFDYDFTPSNINRTKDGIYFSEQFDDEMGSESRDLAAALAHCRAANVLLHSKKVSHRLYMTEKQLMNFRETYKLYRLMGGKL